VLGAGGITRVDGSPWTGAGIGLARRCLRAAGGAPGRRALVAGFGRGGRAGGGVDGEVLCGAATGAVGGEGLLRTVTGSLAVGPSLPAIGAAGRTPLGCAPGRLNGSDGTLVAVGTDGSAIGTGRPANPRPAA
jgi:hypothetical protein